MVDAPPVDPERAFEQRDLAPLRAWLDSLPPGRSDTVAALRARAWLARRSGEARQAIALIDRAIELAPDRADLRVDRAAFRSDALADAGAFESMRIARDVRRDLEHALEAEPEHLDTLTAMISFHRRAPGIVGGRDDRADALLERLRAVSEPHYRERLAVQHAADEEYEAAAELMRQAMADVAVVPLEWRGLLGRWLAATGRTPEALQAWLAALAEAPDFAPALFGIGRLAATSGRHTRLGVDTLRRLLDRPAWPDDPDRALAWLHLGELHRREGRAAPARRAFERALELEPDFDEARVALESLQANRNRPGD
ncbi:MAG: tetratricopeptide repeat protein [Candidatus Wenzhouxiangella sp. M2_3B_020]